MTQAALRMMTRLQITVLWLHTHTHAYRSRTTQTESWIETHTLWLKTFPHGTWYQQRGIRNEKRKKTQNNTKDSGQSKQPPHTHNPALTSTSKAQWEIRRSAFMQKTTALTDNSHYCTRTRRTQVCEQTRWMLLIFVGRCKIKKKEAIWGGWNMLSS